MTLIYLSLGLWVLAFGVFNPEAFVASRNIDAGVVGTEQELAAIESGDPRTDVDTRYLTNDLGDDAVPAIVARLDQLELDQPNNADQVRNDLCRRSQQPTSSNPFGFNFSVHRANRAIQQLGC